MSERIITVKNVTKKYGKNVVLKDISLNIDKGKIYGFVGRNGSGKTMLMKCICGFVSPTEGEIRVFDKTIGKDVEVPDNIGIIIETPGFIQNYSGYKNLQLLASVKNKISKEDIAKVMKVVGLDFKSKKHVGKYSLGMRQRLGIAQAIMEKPKLLILDEPMNGLDNEGVDQIREILANLNKEGTTIILASHNSEDIRLLCDNIYLMDKGKIVGEKQQKN